MTGFNTEWLLAIAVALITAGIILSVAEEWVKVGLNDTSVASLCLWISGLSGIILWSLMVIDYWVLAVLQAPALIVMVYWLGLKWRDSRCVKRRRR